MQFIPLIKQSSLNMRRFALPTSQGGRPSSVCCLYLAKLDLKRLG